MQYLTKLSTSPTEPLSLEQMYDWLRQDPGSDDDILGTNITAARLYAEGFQRRPLASEQFRLRIDHFPFFLWNAERAQGGFDGLGDYGSYGGFEDLWGLPGGVLHPDSVRFALELPRSPFISIEAFTYLDPTGTTRTVDPSAYQVITGDDVAPRIFPADGTFWPMTKWDPAAVTIDFTAGWTAGTLPKNTLHALKILAAHFYSDRSGSLPIPQLATTLLYMNRTFEF